MKRRKFGAEFKRKVVIEAMRGDRTAREIAARHGLNPNQMGRWKAQAMDGRILRLQLLVDELHHPKDTHPRLPEQVRHKIRARNRWRS